MSTQDEPADLILHGGSVFTPNGPATPDRAVAVRSGRVIAVGTDEQALRLRGPHTQLVDLHGRMVIPGFQDAHVHPADGGITRSRCDLSGLDTAAEYLDAIGSYAVGHTDRRWVLGGGWAMDAFPRGVPSARPLDQVTGTRPTYLPNADGHTAWVNTAALDLAGITRDTPDPVDGRIERDQDGRPSGALHEGAQRLVTQLIPRIRESDLVAGLLEGQRYLHSLGITAWQDAIVGGDTAENNTLSAYHRLANDGRLTARVVGALWWDRRQGHEQLAELVQCRDTFSAGRFQATSVKLMVDGVIETRTAAMLTPYLDDEGRATAHRGMSFIDPDELPRYVSSLDAAGFQTHFHAIGDRAVRQALDAIESARVDHGYRDTRPHIAHLQVVHPDDVPRFSRLGVIANVQPLWACPEPQMTELTIPLLGPERAAWQYPFASLARHGAQLAGGSDWPVSTPDPLQEIHVAVNRRQPHSVHDEAFLPHEVLSLEQALTAFTVGSARTNHLDRQTGTIQVGKNADLAVLDRNILTEPADAVAEAHVVLTLVDGQAVYQAGDL